MKNRLIVFISLLILLCFMPKTNAQTTNIITGYVYSSDDRMPVADANVMFEPRRGT